MAIEKNFPNTEKLTDTLKSTQFREAGAPGKIETTVQPPSKSYLADLKELVDSLGFTYVNDTIKDMICYRRGNWQLFLYVNPVIQEIIPGGPTFINAKGHRTYIQWNLCGGGLDIRGLTPGDLFFVVKG